MSNANIQAYRQTIKNSTWLVQEEPRGPSQLIEIPVLTNGLSQVPQFPTQPNLQSDTEKIIILKALRVIPVEVLAAGPTSGNPTVPLTELAKLSLSIYCEGWLKAQNIPLLTLIDTFIEGSGVPFRNRTMQFNNWERVMWEKCTLDYSNGTASAGTPYTILLEAEYVRLNKDWQEIIGPK